MAELKPCPFCGSEALISWNTKFGWQAFCENDLCFMSQIISTTFETEEQAIYSWNDRTQYEEQKPIIRCKDCKYWHDPINCQMDSEGMKTSGDWFCADAKRR